MGHNGFKRKRRYGESQTPYLPTERRDIMWFHTCVISGGDHKIKNGAQPNVKRTNVKKKNISAKRPKWKLPLSRGEHNGGYRHKKPKEEKDSPRSKRARTNERTKKKTKSCVYDILYHLKYLKCWYNNFWFWIYFFKFILFFCFCLFSSFGFSFYPDLSALFMWLTLFFLFKLIPTNCILVGFVDLVSFSLI